MQWVPAGLAPAFHLDYDADHTQFGIFPALKPVATGKSSGPEIMNCGIFKPSSSLYFYVGI